jgi:ketosteroid isomerase-like protein
MNAKFANKFAADWISAWNKADLSAVLAHYTDDFEMSSPNIRTVFGEPSGRLVGKERVREYWQMMLSKFGMPQMELVDVFAGSGSIAIEYHNRGLVLQGRAKHKHNFAHCLIGLLQTSEFFRKMSRHNTCTSIRPEQRFYKRGLPNLLPMRSD